MRLGDWPAGGDLEVEGDVACGDLLVGHEVLHAEEDFEAELVAF